MSSLKPDILFIRCFTGSLRPSKLDCLSSGNHNPGSRSYSDLLRGYITFALRGTIFPLPGVYTIAPRQSCYCMRAGGSLLIVHFLLISYSISRTLNLPASRWTSKICYYGNAYKCYKSDNKKEPTSRTLCGKKNGCL